MKVVKNCLNENIKYLKFALTPNAKRLNRGPNAKNQMNADHS